MKLYNRQEFLALPAGVVFAKYEPNCFGEWKIKGESWANDFHYQPFWISAVKIKNYGRLMKSLIKLEVQRLIFTQMVCLKLFAVLEAE